MHAAVPATQAQLGSYTQKARARVFWGHRRSEIVHSLERKGVRRTQAQAIVRDAVTERSAMLLREGLVLGAWAAALLALTLLAHSPGLLQGEALRPFDLQHLSPWAVPPFVVFAVFAARAGHRLLRGALRLE